MNAEANLFLRFLLVGLLNTAIGLGMMLLLLHSFHFSYWGSTFIGNAIGACVSFYLNRSFTFRSNIPIIKGFPIFCTVVISCYLVAYTFSAKIANWFLPSLFLENLILQITNSTFARLAAVFIDESTVAVIIGSLLYTIMNYVGQKRIVFLRES